MRDLKIPDQPGDTSKEVKEMARGNKLPLTICRAIEDELRHYKRNIELIQIRKEQLMAFAEGSGQYDSVGMVDTSQNYSSPQERYIALLETDAYLHWLKAKVDPISRALSSIARDCADSEIEKKFGWLALLDKLYFTRYRGGRKMAVKQACEALSVSPATLYRIRDEVLCYLGPFLYGPYGMNVIPK